MGICYRDGVGVKKDMKKARDMWELSYKYGNREGAELLARSLEELYIELVQNPKREPTEAEYQMAEDARGRATSIWHDIVRWHDDSHPVKLRENPETGDYETDEWLTY